MLESFLRDGNAFSSPPRVRDLLVPAHVPLTDGQARLRVDLRLRGLRTTCPHAGRVSLLYFEKKVLLLLLLTPNKILKNCP